MPEQTGTNVVDVYVNYLRRKVDEATAQDAHASTNYGGLIETVRGAGYRLGGMGKKSVGRHPVPTPALAGMAYA